MPVALAVFDIAGTTVQDNNFVARAFTTAFQKKGFSIGFEEVNPLMGFPKPLAIEMILEQSGSRFDKRLICEIHSHFVKEMKSFYSHSEEVKAMPHTETVFAELKRRGVRIALNTGFSKDIADVIVDRFQWLKKRLIDDYIGSDEVEKGRPYPEMMHILMKKSGVENPSMVAKATSFIFASGFTQSAGKFIMLRGNVNQWWMPFITGLLFLFPLLFSLWLLEKTLPPDAQDVAERTERKPMDSLGRKRFLRTFLPGLVLLIMSYIILTVLRDYRSNFAADMWSELGRKEEASLFTRTEIPASIAVLGMMSLLILVKQNLRALILNHVIIVVGFILTLCATVLFDYKQLSPFWWFTLTGIGLYMSYVPFNAMLFDRLIASFRYVSNAGFIIYVADAFGYLGSDAMLVVKSFIHSSLEWTAFFIDLVFYGSIAGITMVIFSAIYFYKKHEHYFFEYHKIKYV